MPQTAGPTMQGWGVQPSPKHTAECCGYAPLCVHGPLHDSGNPCDRSVPVREGLSAPEPSFGCTSSRVCQGCRSPYGRLECDDVVFDGSFDLLVDLV